MSDEPVAFLGGQQGAPPPKKGKPPAGGGDGDEVVGYLGGAEGDLPSLPPQEEKASYSAHDFIQTDAPAEADPYADPYAQPQEGGEYEGYDAGEAAQADPAYFDSMAHGGEAAPADAANYAAEDDPDQPKTISQQDAESIIRRITTKRILPPEQEKKAAIAPPPRLTATGGGVRIWPILFVLLILGGAAVFLFGEQIAEAVPELREYMPWLDPKEAVVIEPPPPKEDPVAKAKKDLLELVIKSEAKAFGVAPKDVPPLGKAPAAPGTATGTAPPAGTGTPPAGTGTPPAGTETPKAPGGN